MNLSDFFLHHLLNVTNLTTLTSKAMLAGILCLSLVACDSSSTNNATSMSGDTKNTNDAVQQSAEQSAEQLMPTFATRLSSPRVPPLPKENRTPEQIEMLASRPDYNLYKTLAHHVELYRRWTPLGSVLLNGSTLPARDREIIMLRMGWLCQSEYEWSQHARIATADNIGMTNEEVFNIAASPDGESWNDFERTLMDMVDELRYDGMISDATWKKLSERYTQQEIIDAIFTAAQYQLVSMVLNSTGIQLDPVLEHRLPTDIPLPKLAQQVQSARLAFPRIAPLEVQDMTEEQRNIIAGQVRDDGTVYNLYATMINHPALYGPRYTFGSYLLRDSNLPAQTRELLILRTGWLLKAEYEWAHHAPMAKEAGLTDEDILRVAQGPHAAGWNEEQRAVLQAADELRSEAFIHDATWATLSEYYDTKQMVEILFTVGGYSMTAFAINSLGIQVEDGFTGFPESE